jgi:hypothetical protein
VPDGDNTLNTLAVAELEKRIREADLRALDDYQRGTADAPVIYKADGYSKAVEDNGPAVYVASEESEDRIGDVISIAGWDLTSFRRNPVWMFIHNLTVAPLGIVPKIWTEGKQLLNTVTWDNEDELARFIKGKYDRKVMRAVSVGFRAMEFEERSSGEGPTRTRGIYFKKQELLEISAVPVPMHPHALQKAMDGKAFSIVVPDLSSIGKIEDNDKKAEIGLLPLIDEKAGAVLNKANKDKLNRASTLIQEVITSAGTPQEEASINLTGSVVLYDKDTFHDGIKEVLIDTLGPAVLFDKDASHDRIREMIQEFKESLKSASAA